MRYEFFSPSPSQVDANLARRVRVFLGSLQSAELTSLVVHADGGTVTLSGQVSSHFQKQLAHECARRVSGVQRVDNHLEVVSQTPERPQHTGWRGAAVAAASAWQQYEVSSCTPV